MQGTVVLRLLAAFAFGAAICGCNTSTGGSAAGHTPVPSKTTLAQAQATSLTGQRTTSTPAGQYAAVTGPGVKNVTFSLWANGMPIGTIKWPQKAIVITKDLHADWNDLVIQWSKEKKDGTGSVSIESAYKKEKILTANVRASSPMKGQVSKKVDLPPQNIGRGYITH
jgi:hypothetical protein